MREDDLRLPDSGALLARDAELAQVVQAWSGGAGALCLAGEAGIGKTVLWETVLKRCRDAGWRVLSAMPAEAEADMPYAVLGDLLGGCLDAARPDLPDPQLRAVEVALLRRPVDGAVPQPHAVALATTAVLRTLAEQCRLVLAVDDVQWMDRDSGTAVAFALRRLPPDRVRALFTMRTGEPTAAPFVLAREVHTIHVGPLDLDATQRLLARELGERATAGLSWRLHESARGNPLHALELGRSVARSWPWAADSVVPPSDLAELVRQRVAELADDARELLVAVAAMSRPAIGPLLAAYGPRAEALVGQGEAAGLLRRVGDRLWFVHPLYATACYREAPVALRASVHSRLAGVVTDPERRARHLALAAPGPDRVVAEHLDVGAGCARARGAPRTAADLAELARVLTPAADAVGRATRARAVAQFLLEAGDAVQARRTLERLRADQQAGPERSRTLTALAAVLFEQEGVSAMREVAWQALAEAEGSPAAEAAAHLILAERAELPIGETRRHAQLALDFFDGLPDPDPALLASALKQVAIASWREGNVIPPELMQRATEMEDQSASLPPVAWRARTCQGECIKYLDEFAAADELLLDAWQRAEREGDLSSMSDIAGHRAELALWLGRWTDAETAAGQAVENARQCEQRGRLGLSAYFRSLVHAHTGGIAQARRDADFALEEGMSGDDGWSVALARTALGFIDLSCDDPRAALRHLDEVDAFFEASDVLAEPRQWRYLGDHVEALVRCAEVERAADRLDRMRRWADGMATTWPSAATARATGLLAHATGRAEDAVACLEESVTLFKTLPLPFEQARSELALGSALRRVRRRRDARETLTSARDTFSGLGAPLWLDKVERELARLGGRTSSGNDLTESEARVAGLVAQGLSNREVAAALVVTARTVESHLTRVYAKLGVRSRVELARRLTPTAPTVDAVE
ncbi:AAA family ATPase [Nocardioides terrisoli]|uniref:AAA family ATPase n=1 Tax=Nocardioides terrisoli TaxID=3388267 RepID=UPI00287B732E|nr:AAA family ATPase [Nocardioides marmorisolisilvae]